MNSITYLDYVPRGWRVLDVARRDQRGWDWAALIVNYDPDDLHTFDEDDIRKTQRAWFCIPGKHRSRNAAWDAVDQVMATKH